MIEPAVSTKGFFDYFPGPVLTVIGNDSMSYNSYMDVTLAAENKIGKPIYFVPNEVDGSRRLDEKIIRCRSVFLDDDSHKGPSRADDFPLLPNLALETSPGKWHYHWLTDTTDIQAWRGVMIGMIETYGMDPACKNPARIMRVPGYVNPKKRYNGWVVTCTELRSRPYSWADIKLAFPISEVEAPDFKDKPKFDPAHAIQEMMTGENIHEARRSLAMQCANRRLPKEYMLELLNSIVKNLMETGVIDAERGKERLGNMKQAFTSAYVKVESELSNVEAIRPAERSKDKFTNLSRPPGALGDIADDIMNYMQFPSWEMALPVAMHCTSMFGGGIYRLWTTTGCRKREILAGSSRGKSICTRYPKEIMRRLAVGDKRFKHNPYSYGGTAAWTPTAIHADLVEHRVRGYTIAEGGLDKKSKAGSVEEMRKLWLEALTASHKSHLESKQYSMRSEKGINDKLIDVYGAVVVQLVESVPVHYVEALRGSHSHEGGDTGRTEVIFVPKGRPRRNRTPEEEIGDDVVKMMRLFIRKFEDMNCMGGGDPTNPDKFIKMDTALIQEAWYALDDKISDSLDAGDMTDIQDAIMGRFMERVNTTVYVLALADSAYGVDELSVPRPTMEHFAWAVEYQEELNRSLFANLDGGMLADPIDRCKDRVAARMDNFGDIAYDKIHAANMRDRIVGKQWVTKVMGRASDWRQLIVQHGSLQRAQNELYNALESDGVLIPVPVTGKVRQWRLNK